MEKLVVIVDKLKVGRQALPKGAEFEVSHKVAKLLKDMGRAAPAGEPKASRADLPKAVMQRASKEEAEEPAPLAPTYQRRDMQAAGQTGEAKPARSSRRGRPPRVYGSTAFEEDE